MKNSAPSRRFLPRGRELGDMPIRRKLMLVVVATTALALLLAGIGLVFADLVLFRGYLKNDLSALSSIIADNTTGSLSFDDPAAANETLGALKARAHVLAACIYQNDGEVFSQYNRPGTSAVCPVPETAQDIRFDRKHITVSRPIIHKGERLGTLVLLYDLGELYERARLYGAAVLTVFLFSTYFALLLSARLRSLIATPIAQLAGVTSRVSESRDYSIRAQKLSGDELGLLVDAFNEMLSGIQTRDSELRKALLAREEALSETQKARHSLEVTLGNIAQLNGELRASNESLARSNEDLERFAFIASHDLQEPLRMITIYSQLLVRHYAGVIDEPASFFVENIEDGTKRMRDLLADLLTYAEIGAKLEQPAETVDLNLVIQKVRENLAFAIGETGAVITAAQLPVVSGLESHFIALFQNLIGNAIKYRGDQPPRVDIAAGRTNGYIQICVADNGIGIPAEYHSKIFVPFKRLHGKKIPGTGIGLAICQRVVERHGGRIWVESEPGQGSNFIFTLPASLVTGPVSELQT